MRWRKYRKKRKRKTKREKYHFNVFLSAVKMAALGMESGHLSLKQATNAVVSVLRDIGGNNGKKDD